MSNEDQAFHSERLKKDIYLNCIFQNCTFEQMRGAQFSFCTFEKCHLQTDSLEGCRIQQCLFQECKLIALPFYQCEKRFFSPEFQQSILMNCNFGEMVIKNGVFKKCKLKECYFTGANLMGSNFFESDLEGTQFHRCNLAKANFKESINYFIDPRSNTLTKAHFSLPEATALLKAFEVKLT